MVLRLEALGPVDARTFATFVASNEGALTDAQWKLVAPTVQRILPLACGDIPCFGIDSVCTAINCLGGCTGFFPATTCSSL
jgi:hypothetical protein